MSSLLNYLKLCKAIQESVFRIIYTSIFGLLSSVLFIKTNTILSPILAHVWCNYFGILFIPQNGNIFNLLAYILGLGKLIKPIQSPKRIKNIKFRRFYVFLRRVRLYLTFEF